MSTNDDGNGGDSGPGTREVARRLFAAEFDDAEYSYSESDEERAPNYVVSPTGERINRLFAVGVLTEVSQAGDSILRARIADPTGAFVVYAGQYQPEAMAFLDRTEPPAFVALTGKARTFQPDDSDVVYSSVRPEEMNVVDRDTRDRWVVTTAERTLQRVGVFGAALDSGLTGEELRAALVEAGVGESLAAGVPIAIQQYGTTRAYLSALQELALNAARLVAGDVDEVGSLDVAPADDDGTFTPALDPALELPAAATAGPTSSGAAAAGTGTESARTATGEGVDSSFEPVEESEPVEAVADTSAGDSGTGTETETGTGTGTGTTAEPTESRAGADGIDGGNEPESSTQAEAADDDTEQPEPEPEQEMEPGAEPAEPEDQDVEFDPDEEVLDEEAREEVEEEFGLEFETGSEMESGDTGEGPAEPAEPEFDPVESEPEADTTAEPEPEFDPVESEEDEADPDSEPEPDSEPAEDPDSDTDSEPTQEAAEEPDGEDEATEDRPVDEVLIDWMESLDDGSGAPREELIAAVTEATGADEAAVEEAIEDALMSGRCYEPDEGRYASI